MEASRRRAVPVSELRASDADRERVARLLSEAMADGRLTLAEHGERIDRVHAARTLGELTGLTTDLATAESQPILVDDRPLLATFGSLRRGGRWVVPVRLPLLALFGTVELDLREAILQRRHVVIDARVLCGRVRLLVPEGVRVDVSGRTILTSRGVRVRPGDGDGVPTVEVSGTLVFGSVRARAPRVTWRRRVGDRLRRPR
ncbi:DUF1707 SHOCT-like domain-containing protein [Actinomadura craniellae]|uniref:DUF1707 SHOCT-like domain-containing protein n=1 Tax=Actinomadura craniellae TaxID=2231787 RepID=UPI001F402F52|nr:DUF1707 domain-containing protein [Actinomadura craniellae]